MKYMSVILVFFLPLLLLSQSHNLQQTVRNWPANCDTGGIHWTVYNLEEAANKWLNEASIGSGTNYVPSSNLIVWNANVGNFPGSPPWLPGDSIIAFGSWDSAYSHDPVFYHFNPNHTGFYWLFSDTLTTQEPQSWQPDDTIRVMPKPLVYLQTQTPGIDSIIIRIPNPAETRRPDQNSYDVLGYELFVAEHIGNPANLVTHVAYLNCQGASGDTTMYTDIESNYTGNPVFYAYRTVMRPDTSPSELPGHQTYYLSINSDSLFLDWPGIAPGYMNTYLSQNSDSVAVSWVAGVEDPESPHAQITQPQLMASPNPFSTSTTISLRAVSGNRSIGESEMCIYDISGRLVHQFSILGSQFPIGSVVWDGKDKSGNAVPEGIYYCRLRVTSRILTEKLIKLQ